MRCACVGACGMRCRVGACAPHARFEPSTRRAHSGAVLVGRAQRWQRCVQRHARTCGVLRSGGCRAHLLKQTGLYHACRALRPPWPRPTGARGGGARARARAALLCACGRTARRSRPPRLRDPLASRLCRDAPACACSRRLPIGCVCIQPQQREWQACASARASPAPTATSPSCACRRLQAALACEHAVTRHPRACSSAVPADQNTAGAAGDSTASCVRVAHTLTRLAAIAVAAGGAGAAVAAGAAAAAAAVAVAAAAAAAVRTPQPRGQGMPR